MLELHESIQSHPEFTVPKNPTLLSAEASDEVSVSVPPAFHSG